MMGVQQNHIRAISRQPEKAQIEIPEELRAALFEALTAALINFEVAKTEVALGLRDTDA